MAQDAAAPVRTLVNSGAPMKIAFDCDQEDLAAVGMSCSDESPCAVYLELSSVTAAGAKVALAGNIHGPSATLYSVLLTSDDGGANWKEPANRIAGAALEQVQILDASHAWAAGEMQVPLARDPFVLIGTDGAAAWKKAALSDDDGGAGAVQKFWFDSAEHGELIVETGRTWDVYDSRTGGESWSVASKAAQLPRLRRMPESFDYRIGSDAKSKSFVIEKRAGEKWIRVASFLVQVASCGAK